MTLRTRVGLAGGVVVLVALAVASVVVYSTVRADLRRQLDTSLAQTVTQSPTIAAQLKQKIADSGYPAPIDAPVDLGSTLVQFVTAPVLPGSNRSFIAVTEQDYEVARGLATAYYQDAVHDGVEYRVLTALVPGARGTLVRVARPLDDGSDVLTALAVLLIALTAVGGLVAALAARLAARRVLRPVRVLTDAVEHVT
ncbi:MAG: histidine kinase, partial [Saccharothrix sp.]|nr:histidine kinase [Saccharothrix sp.]